MKPDLERAQYALGIVLQRLGQTAKAATQTGAVRQARLSSSATARSAELVRQRLRSRAEGQWQQALNRYGEAANLLLAGNQPLLHG